MLMASEKPHMYQGRRHEERAVHGKLVESVNSLDTVSFRVQYVPEEELFSLTGQNDGKLPKVLVGFKSASDIQGDLIDACFRLVEATSADDYRKSELKWSPAKKRSEMALPDLKYIILYYADVASNQPQAAGFLSFMITYEDGHEVVYCYEIHIAEPWQGKGIGKKLMSIMESAGRTVGIEKAMLTVFKSNARALKMYERLGYSEDEFSPRPRELRNGTIKEHTYVILSKNLRETTTDRT